MSAAYWLKCKRNLQHKKKTMNKNSTGFDSKKSQVMTFRVPYSAYEAYERRCIEEHISMSAILREAVKKVVSENTDLSGYKAKKRTNFTTPGK